jgi:putative membrane protein
VIALAYAHARPPVPDAGWNLAPDILGGILVVAALYAAGLRRQHTKVAGWRRAAFFGGLAFVFLALQSPLEAVAERSFFVHQLQHLLLQSVAPMLLMLAAPQAILIAGTPPTLRRAVLSPVFGSRPVRALFGFLARPWSSCLLIVAALYAWHWPPYHDLAVLDDAVHYLMHFTMLAAGLIFFACVFDPRPAPLGARYGTRVNILWVAMTANVLLGAALALKETALYAAYDEIGRPWAMSALQDEQLGALIMWIPGSVAWVPAFMVLLRMWDSHEARLDERRRRGIPPAAASAGTAANNRVALWLALAAFVGFAGTLGIGVMVTRP